MKKKIVALSEKIKDEKDLNKIFNNNYFEYKIISRNRKKNFNKTKYYFYESDEK